MSGPLTTTEILLSAILAISTLFTSVAVFLVLNKAVRDLGQRWRQARRRELEPEFLEWVKGVSKEVPRLGFLDRRVGEDLVLQPSTPPAPEEKARMATAFQVWGHAGRYRKALGSWRWWKRAEAAEKLGLAGIKSALPPLIQCLDDPEPEVRFRAAKALGALKVRAAIKPLIGALAQPTRWSSIRIADILADLGRDVGGDLMEAFPGLDPRAQAMALDILARIQPPGSEVWLIERLSSPHPDVRARACHALGGLGTSLAGSALISRVSDSAWPVRAMAAKALGRLGHLPAIPALKTATGDPEWWVRANSAEALRRFGEPGLEALEELLEGPDAFARHQAVMMLTMAGVLDRRVNDLAVAPESERQRASRLIHGFVGSGQLARLRELARTHPDEEVRNTLTGMLPRRTASEGTS